MPVVHRSEIGRVVRLLRHRAGLTQEGLAGRTGIRRWKLVKLEAGDIDRLRFEDVDRVLGALDARFWTGATYHGAAAERLLDELHAQIVGSCVRLLTTLGWEVRVEVSFNVYGDRGSIDVLAWHAPTRSLLVIEVKSELPGIEGTLRPLDVKTRVAASLARSSFGWNARAVSKVLVLPADRTVRRQVERHQEVLHAALPADSRAVKRWLRSPAGSMAGIWFVSDVRYSNAKRNPSAIRRVRRARTRSEVSATRPARSQGGA